MLVPTICFNCEAACGLLAYVDKDTMRVRKFEGNPLHPASRGRNCAKGPATINQINDPERILYPLQARRPRAAAGKWERVTWDEALDDIGGAHPQGVPRGPAQRGHVPRRPARPRAARWTACCKAWGDRRPQLAHQRLLVRRPGSATRSGRGYDRPEPRPRERALHPAALVAPRVRPLLQPARAADHRGQARGREARGDGPAASNTASHGRLLAAHLPGQRGGGAAGHGAGAPRRGPGRPRVPRAVDELARVPGGPAPGRGADLRRASWPRCRRALRASSRPSSRRPRAACRARQIVEVARAIGAARGALRLPRLARRGQRQPGRLAGRARAAVPDRAHRAASARRAARRPTPGTSSSPSFWEEPPAAEGVERAALPAGVAAQPLRDVASCCRTS